MILKSTEEPFTLNGYRGAEAVSLDGLEDFKDKITKLLEEYKMGGDLGEACRCIHDLSVFLIDLCIYFVGSIGLNWEEANG